MRRVDFNKDYVTGLVNGVLSTDGIPNSHYDVEIKTCDGMDHIFLDFHTDSAMKDVSLFDITLLQSIVHSTFNTKDEPDVTIHSDYIDSDSIMHRNCIVISFPHEEIHNK